MDFDDAIFAPTPPLEALHSIISLAATDLPGRPLHARDPHSETAIDIRQAYFDASTSGSDPTYVALPSEHPGRARGMCGLLKKHVWDASSRGWVATGVLQLLEVNWFQSRGGIPMPVRPQDEEHRYDCPRRRLHQHWTQSRARLVGVAVGREL